MIPDLVTLVLLLLFFIRGFRQGFIVAVFSLFAIIIAIACSLKLSHSFATILADKNIINSSWGLFISYILIFFAALFIVRFIALLIEKGFHALLMGWLNSLAGGVLYLIAGVLICGSLLWMAEKSAIIPDEMQKSSYAFRYLLPIAHWAFDGIFAVGTLASDVYDDIREFIDKWS